MAKYNLFLPEQMNIKAKNEEKIEIKKCYHKQQDTFKILANTDIILTKASYKVAHKIAKQCKLFPDGEFVKECLTDIVELLCPDKLPMFEKICVKT